MAVQDPGVRIDPNDVDRLFNALFTTTPGGKGIGLSISRSIIEAYGARLWATANAPQGAIVHFCLPVRPASSLRNIALNSSPSES